MGVILITFGAIDSIKENPPASLDSAKGLIAGGILLAVFGVFFFYLMSLLNSISELHSIYDLWYFFNFHRGGRVSSYILSKVGILMMTLGPALAIIGKVRSSMPSILGAKDSALDSRVSEMPINPSSDVTLQEDIPLKENEGLKPQETLNIPPTQTQYATYQKPYPGAAQPSPTVIHVTQVNNASVSTKSPKSRAAAALLCFFFGLLGIHRFYLGKVGTGLIWMFTGGLFGIGAFLDFFIIIFGGMKDAMGLPV